MKRNKLTYTFFIASLFFIFTAVLPQSIHCEEKNELQDLLDNFAIQQLILSHIRNDYIDSVNYITVHDGAIQGIIDKLDPHTSYMPPDTADEFNEKIRGNFEGIGITFALLDGKITIIDVIQGGPSEKAGLRSRDKIEKIDGENAIGIHTDSVKVKLRGPSGSGVTVHVARPGVDGLLQFTIIRDKVNLDSVSYAYMLNQETGYIAINKFTTRTDIDVHIALATLRSKGMKKLVLDLRNNSGGTLETAIEVVDCFIKDGIIVKTIGRREVDNRILKATGTANHTDIPMIVLINHGSASASEIVAGALQDHDRALIVGQTSFGKGLVMTPYTLKNEAGKNLGSLILTVARYYTPSGRLIQRPYDNGKENYIREGFDEIDLNAADTLQAGKTVFFTVLGRKVYGEGGITPDRKLNPLPRLNRLESILRSSNLFFEFSDEYLLRHNDIPKDFNEFLYNYNIPEDEIIRFKQFITEKGIEIDYDTIFMDELDKLVQKFDLPPESVNIIYNSLTENNIDLNETLFEQSIYFIKQGIKREIARMLRGPEEYFRILCTDDTELKQALSYFGEAEELLKKRIAMGKEQTVSSSSQ
ncbi:MAG TPA: S41 family peptidase [Anaerolineae bacterium]|nr:S41 family peptidase [Anaerolineae bacterium]